MAEDGKVQERGSAERLRRVERRKSGVKPPHSKKGTIYRAPTKRRRERDRTPYWIARVGAMMRVCAVVRV